MLSHFNSSLQEVAPLSYAFIGSYFLNPYYARFGEALNLASERVLATAPDGDDEDTSVPQAAAGAQRRTQPYTLVRAKNVGMTAILLFARDPDSIRKIEEAECGFGAADMGNKGAVGLRVTWGGQEDSVELNKTTELTFVATHLAAMEWNLKKRNANWRSIVSGLTFANPRNILPGGAFPTNRAAPIPDRSGAGDIAPRLPTGDSPDPSEEEEEEEDQAEAESESTHPLLPQEPDQEPLLSPAHLAALHSISVYKPTSHLFVAGDLNYRISATTPPPLSAFPSFDPASENYFPSFLSRDQLTRERKANRTLNGLSEAEITFGPTYKFDVLEGPEGADNEEEVRRGERRDGVAVVPWRFAGHRWPGWCDRVLYLDVPGWVKGKKKIEVRAYDGMPVMAVSDHRPVFWRGDVPLLGEGEMQPPSVLAADSGDEEEEEEEGGWGDDPRVRLPVPVDVHAWERRAAARRKEVVVGWSAFVWSTPEGAMLMATALALGFVSWWFLRGG